MAFLETDRIEREDRRELALERTANVICPRCGIAVVLVNGRGTCDMCGLEPSDRRPPTGSTGTR